MALSVRTARAAFIFGAGTCTLIVAAVGPDRPDVKVALPKNPYPQPVVELGRALFRDNTLSNPPGMACISCHDPATGYSYPNSLINGFFGTVPGAVKGRVGNRRPPSLAYAPLMAKGVPHYDTKAIAWVGGLFWDGRALDAVEQVMFPLTNPVEMNNTVNGEPSPEMVVRKLKASPSAKLFKKVYGETVFGKSVKDITRLMSEAIVAYELSPEVSPFTSKYDAWLEGKAELTPQELMGMRLATGTMNGRPNGYPFRKNAHCMDCHGLSDDLSKGPDLLTNSCYANLGVPPNPTNLFYFSKDNPEGNKWIDMGVAGFVYPYYKWTPRTPHGNDPLRLISAFKAPTLRNVDKRPYAGFVKSYMHNGAFKSLKQVVHFYNTRNMTSEPGEVIDYTLPDPYANLKGKPVWPKPEYLNPQSLINPTGMSSGAKGAPTMSTAGQATMVDPDAMQIGNLMLTESQEDAIVAFLKTLTDGYFKRN